MCHEGNVKFGYNGCNRNTLSTISFDHLFYVYNSQSAIHDTILERRSFDLSDNKA